MKITTSTFFVLVILGFASSVFGQIKLNTLDDFVHPTGDWFEAKSVKLDADDNASFKATMGEGCLVNGPTGKTDNLISKESFGDVEFYVEFMVPKGSNSGIYFQSRYEIQVFDSWGVENPQYLDCGGVYQRWDKSKPKSQRGYEGIAPRVNACKAPGEWQSYNVIFRAPRFDAQGEKIKNALFERVVLNGVVIHVNKEVSGATREGSDDPEIALAPFKFQGDHGPVAYRNMRIRKLDNIRESKPNTWVDLFENTPSGPNYDLVVHGDAAPEDGDKMLEYDGKSLKAMYKWEPDSSTYAIAVTKKVYSSYDLKFDFTWGDRRFKPRLNLIKDAGLLYHCQSGCYAWPPSLEYQIQEGDFGDLWCIMGCHCDVLKDGAIIKHKQKKYSSAKKWEDQELPGWNKVLIEVRGDKAKYFLNGVLVNEIVNATYGGLTLSSGFICLQAEFSEAIYRDIKIKEIVE